MNLSTAGSAVYLAYGELLAGNRGHRLEGAAEAVRDRREDVHVLAVGKVVQKPQEDQGVDPPENALGRRKGVGKKRSHQGGGHMLADRHEKRRGRRPHGDFGAVHAEEGEHEARHEAENQKGIRAFIVDMIRAEDQTPEKGQPTQIRTIRDMRSKAKVKTG